MLNSGSKRTMSGSISKMLPRLKSLIPRCFYRGVEVKKYFLSLSFSARALLITQGICFNAVTLISKPLMFNDLRGGSIFEMPSLLLPCFH